MKKLAYAGLALAALALAVTVAVLSVGRAGEAPELAWTEPALQAPAPYGESSTDGAFSPAATREITDRPAASATAPFREPREAPSRVHGSISSRPATDAVEAPGVLEGTGSEDLLRALLAEAGGERPRRLEYAWGLVLDRMREDPALVALVLAAVRESTDAGELGVLVQVLEDHANQAAGEELARLEREFLSLVASDASEPRANAALHYLLTVSASGSLTEETCERVRALAGTSPSGVVRAGSLWIAAQTSAPSERDASFLAALESDADATVRETAAEGLGTLGEGILSLELQARVVALLSGEREPAVRRALLGSLSVRGVEDWDAAVQVLAGLAESETDPETRRSLVAAVFEMGGESARPWLERWKNEPRLAGEVATYIELLDGQDEHSHI